MLIIVVLIFYRLARVLGMRNEGEQEGSRRDAYRLNRDALTRKPPKPHPDLRLVEDSPAPTTEEEAVASEGRGLAYLRDIESDFDEDDFLRGARRAYEAIIAAFAAGDTKTLGTLLTADVKKSFATAIAQRKKQGLRMETEIIDMTPPQIADILIAENNLRIAVDFRVRLASRMINAQDEIVDGAVGARISEDRWTFERPLHAADTLWRLAATEQPEETL